MKIYTKTGDAGTTGLLGGERVAKDDSRIEAYGTVDELNALLGVARSLVEHEQLDAILEDIQNHLFSVGALLASPDPGLAPTPWIEQRAIESIEDTIDQLDGELPSLSNFILPAGTAAAACLHSARAVCRRAERRVVTLHGLPGEQISTELIVFLNRLGDLLFVMSRYANKLSGQPDVAWNKPGAQD